MRNKSFRGVHAFGVVVACLALAAMFIPFFSDSQITGFVVVDRTVAYEDVIGSEWEDSVGESTYLYTWFPSTPGDLRSLKLNGVVEGSGSVRVTLVTEDAEYLVYKQGAVSIDAEAEAVENASLSLSVASSESDQILGFTPSLDVVSDNLCSVWEVNSERVACYGDDACCTFVGLPYSAEWDSDFFLSLGRYGAVKENIVEVQTILYDVDFSIPRSDIQYSNKVAMEAIFETDSLEEVCVDTCGLVGLNASAYVLRIEVDNASLRIEGIGYGIAEQLSIPDNPPALVADISNVTVYENYTATVDLSQYFGSSGALAYTPYTSENIDFIVRGDILTITPHPGFTGTRASFVTANDSYLTAVSNIFTISVVEKPFTSDDVVVTETLESGAVRIGTPVRWVKRVTAERAVTNLSVNLSHDLINITLIDIETNRELDAGRVLLTESGRARNLSDFYTEIEVGKIEVLEQKLQDEKRSVILDDPTAVDEVRRINSEILDLQLEKNLITGFVVVVDEEPGLLTRFVEWVSGDSITGLVVAELVDEEVVDSVLITQPVSSVEIEYYTEGPRAVEENVTGAVRLVHISSDIHYEDVLAFSRLSQELPREHITVHHLVNDSRNEVAFFAFDTNNNSLIDYIEWNVPHLSNQTYEISLTILNVQSYPVLGGEWTVAFNVTGVANLTIEAMNGTTYSEYYTDSNVSTNDLLPTELSCNEEILWSRAENFSLDSVRFVIGNDTEVSFNETLNQSLNLTAIKVINYTCNTTGYHTIVELTTGKHWQAFSFGNLTAYAKNDVGADCDDGYGNTGNGAGCNFLDPGDDTCIDMDDDYALESTDDCHSSIECDGHYGSSCSYYDGYWENEGICSDGSGGATCATMPASGEHGTGLTNGAATDFHDGDEYDMCSSTELQTCVSASGGFDPTAEGICLDDACSTTTGPAVLDCTDQDCAVADISDSKVVDCDSSCSSSEYSWACDSATAATGWVQDGIWAYDSASTFMDLCITSGYVCYNEGMTSYYNSHDGGSTACDTGDACDATLTDGNFDSTYGTMTAGGECAASVSGNQFDGPDVGTSGYVVNGTSDSSIVEGTTYSSDQEINFTHPTWGLRVSLHANFSTGNVNLTNMSINQDERTTVTNFTSVTNVPKNHTLFVPSREEMGVIVCPHENILENVTADCPDVVGFSVEELNTGATVERGGVIARLLEYGTEDERFMIMNLSGSGVQENVAGCGAVLGTIGQNYSLAKNIASSSYYTCLTINATNVTLDCRGFNITYANSGVGAGINISKANNVRIHNCDVRQYAVGTAQSNSPGILLQFSNNTIIENTTVFTNGSTSVGIYMDDKSNYNIITNVSIQVAGGNGIELYGTNNVINYSRIVMAYRTGSTGVYLNNENNSIDHNVINGTDSGYGVLVFADRNNITANRIVVGESPSYGISVDSNNNTIRGNNISVKSFSLGSSGIFINGVDYNMIYNNTFQNVTGAAIHFYSQDPYTQYNNISNNTYRDVRGYDLEVEASSAIYDNWFIDYGFSNYSIPMSSSTLRFKRSGKGIINFAENRVGDSGDNLSKDVLIKHNFAGVNSELRTYLNTSTEASNITLYNVSDIGVTNHTVLRNGKVCNASTVITCVNFTRLNDATVTFAVEHFSNYTINGTPPASNTAPTVPTIFYPVSGTNYTFVKYLNFSSTDTQGDPITYAVYINGTLNVTTTTNVTSWNASDGMYNMTVSATDGTDSSDNATYIFFRQGDTTAPAIDFKAPTPANGSTITTDYATINISIDELNLKEVIFDWNNTNFTIFNDSLVLMMNFENRSELGESNTKVVDVSAYGNDGTMGNGNEFINISNGKYGGTAQFDGTGDYVNIGDPADGSLDFGTGNFTMSAWIKSGTVGSREIFIAKDDDTGDGIWYFELGNGVGGVALAGKLGVYIYQDGSNNYYKRMTAATARVDDNVWHHVVGAIDKSDTINIYVDGVLQTTETSISTGTYANINVNNNDNLRIGDDNRISSAEFSGQIDEVRIWNRSLSAAEISQYYMSNLQKFNSTHWELYVNRTNASTSGLVDATYTYSAHALDDFGNRNQTEERTLTVDATAPGFSNNATNATLGRVDGNLTFNITLTDDLGLSYWIFSWNASGSWDNVTNSTASGTTYDLVINKSPVWPKKSISYRWYANDTAGNWNSSRTRSFLLLNTPPSNVTLDRPDNNSAITNRTPNFNWTAATDTDNESATYTLLIERVSCSDINNDCFTDLLNITGLNSTNYTLVQPLDVDSVYNWTVQAFDGENYSTFAARDNFTVDSLNAISLNVSTTNFGELNLGILDNTSDDSPVPITVSNEGNIIVNLSLYANQSLWLREPLNTTFFRFMAGNETTGAFNWSGSVTTFTNVTSYAQDFIKQLDWNRSKNIAEIELEVTSPTDEPDGKKETFVFVESVWY